MRSRIAAVSVAVTVIMFTGCSGTLQSDLTPNNGSLATAARSQSALGRSVSMLQKAAVTETVLHSFAGSPTDGSAPTGLTNISGTLYGTTAFGGKRGRFGWGTVFSLTTSGVETILYKFAPGAGGYYPQSGLSVIGDELYGTTSDGGTNGDGTVFRIRSSGTAKRLYSFAGGPNDGADPDDLIDVNGTIYGTTAQGGASGDGTVFTITPKGVEAVLYSFKGGTDGVGPGDLYYLKGAIYGLTYKGGGSGCVQGEGCGTVFKITPAGAYSQLHQFGNENDGQYPSGYLDNVGGKLYGTTAFGGAYREGTIFQITASGAERVLYSFTGGSDGGNPYSGLLNVNGSLYGTTFSGGAHGGGTVFEFTTDGTFTNLYNFDESPYDGRGPTAALTNVNGTIYGLTSSGGAYQDGTVFSLSGF